MISELDEVPLPELVRPTTLDNDANRASAVLRLPARSLAAIGERVVATDEGLWLEELGDQPSFAGAPLAEAWSASSQRIREILDRITVGFRLLFGSEFSEPAALVTVRLDRRSDYRQLQGPHIDWARTRTFRDDDWLGQECPDDQSLRALERCHSIDCVLGGPATEFLLDEQLATVGLVRNADDKWSVDRIDFDGSSRVSRGVTGRLLYRPPFTVHQFPAVESWVGRSDLRLFVSCDYWHPV
jgi:hypothetical protein